MEIIIRASRGYNNEKEIARLTLVEQDAKDELERLKEIGLVRRTAAPLQEPQDQWQDDDRYQQHPPHLPDP